ncbi:hypothetical protein A2962_02370 [Candidatus Woesebacteria bacterium RIFCSPLOWO2_01_FULL_39_61]|uniref:Uncharacterized protein n=1 Tax=Candidatus Woesebacteria bacterium RIFCSPHIGHO2_02_FULL_39_13 TaxID=1802505 RepID=A0A1F7Z3J6_9BACT|nr:MAG: hypothetical protein A2692_01385 [Candidatus Woesebacteria bacterium RIFCSPHIGHO2_01_FULL_39_95]OGM34004.1 MAG: hypothetical protein A3D01_03675 [Candidatus Woesebacteria bacterium RIFCSPHIGHO2_02_FULL_39_13]OGM38262.1 MAG: hypothetical protein A3E13_05785 [Candidatus Woesebacteria bacterium RIFCSPHIGHO2_12_FULL_40_20]OGM66968.1 MAG: hypothetical protein A2962_02370 [Candidatus Woesebacteria bacterium RIFCSPLOWO2_01_FULL_39_61]OGM75500.1 MAG: hypothetical protein A3H19_00540 [Candidatus
MNIKLFDKKYFLTFLAAVVVIVLSVVITQDLGSLKNKPEISSAQKSLSVEENVQVNKNDPESPNFYTETRIYKSPAVTGVDNKKRAFTLHLPEGWSIEKENTDSGFYISFKKDNSMIIISEYGEGGNCIFPEHESIGEFGYVRMDNYKNIETSFGTYRIGKRYEARYNDVFFNLCRKVITKDPYTDSPWHFGTQIGYINYSTKIEDGKNYDPEIVQEMENIIKNIQVIEK